MKTAVIVIPEHFADWEYSLLAPILHSYAPGYQVRYASTDTRAKTSMGNLRAIPDLALADIPADSAALILIGAQNSWRTLAATDRTTLAERCRAQKNAGRILAGICDGAWFLAANGILNDCRHTGNSPQDLAQEPAYNNAANYHPTRREAVSDGNIITASGMAAHDFSRAILLALGDIPADVLAYLDTP